MATSAPLNLVTGKTGSAHVTAQETRAFNRAIYGNGNYRLYDSADSGNVVTVSLTTDTNKTFEISAGSLLWNGMHIRITDKKTISTGSTASTYYIYLQYINSAGIETVTINASTSAPTFTPNASFGDEDTPVNVLLYSANGYAFPLKKAAVDLVEAVSSSVSTKADKSSLDAEVTNRTNADSALESLLKKPFYSYSDSTTKSTIDRVSLGSVPISGSASQYDLTTGTTTLSESINNFAFIELRTGKSGGYSLGIFPSYYFNVAGSSAVGSGSVLGSAGERKLCHSYYYNTSSTFHKYEKFYSFYCEESTGKTITFLKPITLTDNAYGTQKGETIYFYGIGRVS